MLITTVFFFHVSEWKAMQVELPHTIVNQMWVQRAGQDLKLHERTLADLHIAAHATTHFYQV
jgi:hypothetical protein